MSMKKSMVKGICLGLVSMLLLAGCGSQTSTAPAADGKKVRIEYWHVNAET